MSPVRAHVLAAVGMVGNLAGAFRIPKKATDAKDAIM